MALRGLAKARDYDYSNVGKQGRRTGITLKEGRRDEHGMEELDGMFSSPERSPVRFNGVNNGDDEVMGSEGMSIDEGNGPGPTDFLSRSATRRSPFFPPVARSPRKSGLSGSPRRTPGLRSSPMVQNDPVSSSPTSGRQRRDTTAQSARQPLNDRRANNTVPITNGMRQKSRDFDSNTGEFANDENLPVQDEEEDEEEDEAVNEFQPDVAEEDFGVHEIDDGDDNSIPDDNGSDNDNDNGNDVSEAEEEEEASPIQAASLRNKNKRPAATSDVEEDIPQSPPKKKRAGRPPKSQSSAKQDEPVHRPAKKAKTSKPQATEPLDPELEKIVENHVNRTGPLKGRSLYILKREEPSNDQTAHTRSGRVSVRPLAYWRNERCVYGDGEADVGQRYPLSTIKEIIRTEELQPEKRKGGKKRKTSGKKSKRDDSSDDEADERDEWEKEEGVLHGYVKKWDSEKQTVTGEEEVSEIAYVPSGVEVREVKDSTFKLGKMFSQSFMGSGIVELPPKGVKRPKNSKRMHMIFCVFTGRVQVDINGVQFTAGKGCMFQVPRGNHYSFANTYHKGARLFFTQAFEPMEGEISSASKADTEADAGAGAENDNENDKDKDNATEVHAPGPKRKAKTEAKTTGKGRGRRPKAKE